MKNSKFTIVHALTAFCVLHFALLISAQAQETPPAPQAPKSVVVPAVKESKLPNGLTVAVVERRNVPIVTVQLLVFAGAANESAAKAGLANLTAELLTKGTKTRTASQIAEEIEFLGGSINTGAGWNNAVVSINVMSDKLEQALAVMSDVVLNPPFKQEELDLLKSQTLDGLTYNLKQPGFLANYVAAKYSYKEHPAGGTPETLNSISRADAANFYKEMYVPQSSKLIFTGDITAAAAKSLAAKFFKVWRNPPASKEQTQTLTATIPPKGAENALLKRILVVDLPNSGQAAVNYTKAVETGRTYCFAPDKCESDKIFYPSSVLNSVLGGGYSSRLNQEIRIKRGLSYGAGSGFAWRANESNFATRTQTKNESAAEVAELVLAEVKRLTEDSVAETELVPRKSVLTGNFGRNLETTEGLAAAIADLYTFGIPTGELNSYTKNVEAVKDAQIREFAKANLLGGDVIIVGDYAVFKDDLAKRFPNVRIDVVKASELDLGKANLRK